MLVDFVLCDQGDIKVVDFTEMEILGIKMTFSKVLSYRTIIVISFIPVLRKAGPSGRRDFAKVSGAILRVAFSLYALIMIYSILKLQLFLSLFFVIWY